MSKEIIYRVCDPKHYWNGSRCRIKKDLGNGFLVVSLLALPADREVRITRKQIIQDSIEDTTCPSH